jgi:NADH-quinone oxidoreductase subunit N
VVALTGLIALIFEMVSPKRDNTLLVFISIVGLLLAGGLLFMTLGDAAEDTGAGMLTHDPIGNVLQLIIVTATALVVLFSDRYLRQKRIAFGEFYPLVLWSSVGAMLMVSAINWLAMFLGLEILSIALYVMAGMSRSEEKSEESAMKYFLLGAFASGFLLYGIALIYGASGSLGLGDINVAWLHNAPGSRTLLCCGMGLVLVGLSFKAGFVPFHQWTPDVYEGAPTNVTAFMATVSKIGALGALWRVIDSSSQMSAFLVPVLGAIAILTMLVGNIVALAQNDVKRVLAYSSIAHSGYILVALVAHSKAGNAIGNATLCYYLLGYTFMTVGSFAIVAMFAKSGEESTSYESLHGLWSRSRGAAACLVVFMLSLIGLPIFAGFFGKMFVLADAVRAGLSPLAIVLAVSSIISAGYYLRIARAALVPDETIERRTSPFAGGLAASAALCAIGVIAVAVFYTPLMNALQIDTSARVAASLGRVSER